MLVLEDVRLQILTKLSSLGSPINQSLFSTNKSTKIATLRLMRVISGHFKNRTKASLVALYAIRPSLSKYFTNKISPAIKDSPR